MKHLVLPTEDLFGIESRLVRREDGFMSLQCSKTHVQSVGCCGELMFQKNILLLWDNL